MSPRARVHNDQLALGGSLTSMSLTEALTSGQGIERPFRCQAHPDTHASASVNILKQVWFCYACHNSGRVDSKVAPSEADILAMLAPARATRIYAERWLEYFGAGYYWLDRFPRWVCTMLSLGQDPLTDEATFPVRLATGELAGIGRRTPNTEGARYLYPRDWAASATLFGYQNLSWQPHDTVIAVVEGAADTAAVLETGCPAVGCYGAGLHYPQAELIARLAPKLIIAACDADEAGAKANAAMVDAFGHLAEVAIADWSWGGAKDPADMTPADRVAVLEETVARAAYRPPLRVTDTWAGRAQAAQAHYQKAA